MVIFKILYWIAVVAVSLALVVGLILWFESRDGSSVDAAFENVVLMRGA